METRLQTITLGMEHGNPGYTLCPGHVDHQTFHKAFEAEGWEAKSEFTHDLTHEYWVKTDLYFKRAKQGDEGAEPYTVLEW